MTKFVKATKKAPLPQRVEVLTYILSYKVGIEADIEAVMPQCKADLKGEVFFKIMRSVAFEVGVIVAIIEPFPTNEKLIFTPLIHIYATLLGFKKLGV